MKIIAFAGPAGAGKNTAADGIADIMQIATLAIADPLYQGLSGLMGFGPLDDDLSFLCRDRDYKTSPNRQLGGLSPRQGLQLLGDWVRGTLGEDYLLRRLEEQIRDIEDLQLAELIVITDVRTDAEATWVRNNGGLLVHVARPGTPEREDDHPTERTLTYHQGDHDLLNDDTPQQLQLAAQGIARAWLRAAA